MSAPAQTAPPPAAAPALSAEEAGRRVDEVLERLAATGDEQARAAAEELVRVLMDFYGTGLARAVDLLRRTGPDSAPDPLEPLLGDGLVAAILVLHDLHPEDLATRVERALDTLPGHPLAVDGHDPATGVLRLRPTGEGGCGCGSTREAAHRAAADALSCFAPEVAAVEIAEPPRQAPLLQIGTRPAGGSPGPAR
ncbi:hypothetical protein ACRAR1_28845 [Streptomyces sanyensis]|uniref:hypothetical protein n=1 Tax=Streptomyces sanyensis TaxID=568869 RepID=UPI003D76C256